MSMELNLPNYLARIGYEGSLTADLGTLAALHAKHVDKIPFEGIDPFLKRPVSLDFSALQAKLVDSRRGGYCFEQNILFKAVLDQIGFTTTGLTARVRWMSPPESPLGPREHMLIRVDLPEGPYLVDVGFGACLMDAPLKLQLNIEQRTSMGTFKLSEAGSHYAMSALQPDGWRTAYVFDLHPQVHADYELGNWYASTSPNVPFAHYLIMERVGGDQRCKVINRTFIIEGRDGELKEQLALNDLETFVRILDEVFDVELPGSAADVFVRLGGPQGEH